jgi:hypothetical protein
MPDAKYADQKQELMTRGHFGKSRAELALNRAKKEPQQAPGL